MAANNIQYPANVGRLTLTSGGGGEAKPGNAVYMLNRRSMTTRKYYPVRDARFTVKYVGEDRYQVLVGRELFDEISSIEGVRATLVRAFDRECIKTGIATATAKPAGPRDEMAVFQRRRYDGKR